MNTTHAEESQHSQQSQRESEENLLTDFIQVVETEYFKQNSTPTSLKLSQIQLLTRKLKGLQNVVIPKSQQMIFIEYLLKYVEMALGFVSNFEVSEYKKQKHSVTALLSFIPDFFKQSDIKNKFVEDATIKILDLFMYGDFTTISKQELLRMFNVIAIQSKKQVRISTAERIMIYMFKLIDSLSTYGDYVMQSDIMETLYRIFGNQIRNNLLKYELLPGCKDLNEALVTEISVHDFDSDVRRWLNKFNEDSQLIFSIACKMLMFGDTVCKCPDEVLWVDFNLKDNIVGFYAGDSDSDQWNRIIIMAKDVKKVEVKRQFGSNANATTISMHLSKPCISELAESQDYWNLLEKHFKMIINNVEKEKITKLISQVLPRIFGDTFSHTSARISDKLKRVYKPLGIKISKRKSTASELSSGTSKSKSDIVPAFEPQQHGATLALVVGPSVSNGSESGLQDDMSVSGDLTTVEPVMQPEPFKSSAITVVSSTVSKVPTDDASLIGIKQSKVKPHAVQPTVVSVVPTDFTRFSSFASDRASVITSNNSELFLSRAASPELLDARSLQKQGQEKVQDNIVTSSHGIHDDILASPRIEILSGQLNGYQSISIHESISFQPSEVFSSSPVKRSWQIITEQVDNEEFHSAEFESVNRKEDDLDDQLKKHSVLKMSEDMLEDEFETAVEVFTETINNGTHKDLDGNDPEYKEENTYNKVSRCVIQRDNSDGVEMVENNRKNRAHTVLSDTTPLKNISCDDSDDEIPLSKLRPIKVTVIDQESLGKFNEIQNNETLTQDMFEAPIQQGATDLLRQEKQCSSDSNSEDIFSRTTQEFPVLNRMVESQGENFTELSLAVNVGVLESQNSGEVAIIETNKKIRDESVLSVIAGKEESDVNIIDLTYEENTAEVIQGTEIRLVEAQTVRSKAGYDEEQKKSLLNTPDLLNMLIQDDSQTTVWKDNQCFEAVANVDSTSAIKNDGNIIDLTDEESPVETVENIHLKTGTSDIVVEKKLVPNTPDLFNVLGQDSSQAAALKDVKVVKDTCTEKTTMEPRKEDKPVKEKKPRQLVKTGKKTFRLEAEELATPPDLVESDKCAKIVKNVSHHVPEEATQTLSAEQEKEGNQKVSSKESFNEYLKDDRVKLKNVDDKDDTSGDVGIPKTTSEKGSSGTDTPEMSESQVIKKNIQQPIIRVERMEIIEKDDSSQSDIELAPEMNGENVNFINRFNELQKADENRLSLKCQESKKTVKRFKNTPEMSESQVIKENIKQPIIRIERLNVIEKDESSHSDIEWAPEINRENVNFINTFNELQKKEENRLSLKSQESDFIQRKTAKRLFSETEIDSETLMCQESKKPSEEEIILTELPEMPGFASKKTVKRFKSARENEDIEANLVENKNKLVQERTEDDIKTVNVEPVNVQSNIPPKISKIVKKSRKREKKKPGRTEARVPLREVNQDVLANTANSNDQLKTYIPNYISQTFMDIPIIEDLVVQPNDSEARVGGNQMPESKITDAQENPQVGTTTLEIVPPALEQNEAEENEAISTIQREWRDSSPEAPPQAVIITAAQVHCTDIITNNAGKPDIQEKGVAVRESKRLMQKNLSGTESVQQETENGAKSTKTKYPDLDLIEVQNSPVQNTIKSKEPAASHSHDEFDIFLADAVDKPVNTVEFESRESPDLDLIRVERSPILKRNKSKEPVARKSPDDFDVLLANNDGETNKADFNKSVMNATVGNKSRKLYKQESFSYLDEVLEQPTPDSELTPAPVKKTVRKQRKPRTKKQEDVTSAENTKKEKTQRRSVRPARESIKEGVKKRLPRKKKDFAFETTDFKSLDGLFDMSCRGILNRTNNYHYGDRNRSFLNQPLDIVVRSERKYSSSDESPSLGKSIDGKKSPQLPKTIPDPKTPPLSSEYSWPELEQVPMHMNKVEPVRKINILRDIVIQPKRPSNGQASNQAFKKAKLVEEQIIEDVPLPTVHEDDEPPVDGFASSHLPEQKGGDILYEAMRLIKFVISLVETKHDPDFIRKLYRNIVDCADQINNCLKHNVD